MLLDLETWIEVSDGDDAAFGLFRRHYSFRPYKDGRREDPTNRNRKLFVGPGEKTVLLTPDLKALFVWRKFLCRGRGQGVNCAVFRNEGPQKSSKLILEAERFSAWRWPGLDLFTFVNPRRIRSSNPGYCFLMAGWRKTGQTSKGLVILEKRPTYARQSPLSLT